MPDSHCDGPRLAPFVESTVGSVIRPLQRGQSTFIGDLGYLDARPLSSLGRPVDHGTSALVPTILPEAVLRPEMVPLSPFPGAETRRPVAPFQARFFFVALPTVVDVGGAVPPNAVRSAVPIGLPSPVHASQPGPAEYAPLLPWVMS